MTDLPLPDDEMAIVNENGSEQCSKCGKRTIYVFDKGINTGKFRHILEIILLKICFGYGFLKTPSAFFTGVLLALIIPNFVWFEIYKKIKNDLFILDGVIIGMALAFFNYSLLLLRKDFGNLEKYIKAEKQSRFSYAVSFIYSKKYF